RERTDFEQIQAEKGKAMGTPYYMAPEQIQTTDDIDIRADIYSLGATWFHMLTGRVPYASSRVEEVLRAHLFAPVPAAHEVDRRVPASYSRVIQVMLSKQAAARYPSPMELLADLEALDKGDGPRPRVAPKTAPPQIPPPAAEPEAPPRFFERPVSL